MLSDVRLIYLLGGLLRGGGCVCCVVWGGGGWDGIGIGIGWLFEGGWWVGGVVGL